MITLNVYNQQGDAVGTVQVDPQEFGGRVNKQLLHEVVLMHLANRRRGTHSTKRRGEVAGSTRKLYRQKGTGRARAGTRRTNKRVGGGTAKGPKPRDYEYHLPKRAVRTATCQAVLSKFLDGETVIVDNLQLPECKTKHMAKILRNLRLEGHSTLIGVDDYHPELHRAARNLPNVRMHPVREFNTYEVLRQKRLLLTLKALEVLRQRARGIVGYEAQANNSSPSPNAGSQPPAPSASA
ncbi:MAG: 50S ribosomal protein L4 [Gemmatales bacterium]|nr:50S ribosomal protein L4 [Gemmatales bacterium]MCS7160671.1 50S ribosomal protein L4 [Gemmatales bacterium]MDW8175872.1 50S ribosomal protein L4 [Gemmatales bacterium]MDW8223246.1 50S ribosomal protein L4 [Gemmatales bacterium]